MTPLRRFELHQPSTVGEASAMLTQFGDEAGVYAGGTELLLAMRSGALRYAQLIDIKVIAGMDSILLRADHLEIGGCATHRSIERSQLVRQKQPVLAEMEAHVANVRVRASGTIGGNLCFAEPHSDPATLLLALDAAVVVEGPEGPRQMGIDQLIDGAFANTLHPGELLTKVRVPVASAGLRAAYLKFQVHERPTLGLALVLATTEAGRLISNARVALGCLCPFPRRSEAAESMLTGSIDDVKDRLPAAARALAQEAELIDDQEGAVDYKTHLIDVFLRRAFVKALGLANKS